MRDDHCTDMAWPDAVERESTAPSASPDAMARVESAAQNLHRALCDAGQRQLADHLRSIRLAWPMSTLSILEDAMSAWDAAGDPDDWGPDVIEEVEDLAKAMADASLKLSTWRARAIGQGELPL